MLSQRRRPVPRKQSPGEKTRKRKHEYYLAHSGRVQGVEPAGGNPMGAGEHRAHGDLVQCLARADSHQQPPSESRAKLQPIKGRCWVLHAHHIKREREHERERGCRRWVLFVGYRCISGGAPGSVRSFPRTPPDALQRKLETESFACSKIMFSDYASFFSFTTRVRNTFGRPPPGNIFEIALFQKREKRLQKSVFPIDKGVDEIESVLYHLSKKA